MVRFTKPKEALYANYLAQILYCTYYVKKKIPTFLKLCTLQTCKFFFFFIYVIPFHQSGIVYRNLFKFFWIKINSYYLHMNSVKSPNRWDIRKRHHFWIRLPLKMLWLKICCAKLSLEKKNLTLFLIVSNICK